MPYQKGSRLPSERASKLGHLEVIQSPLVQKLCKDFEDPEYSEIRSTSNWEELPKGGKELKIIFASDGSFQINNSPQPPYKAITFVKTALLKLDQYALSKIDKDTPHPLALRDLMTDSALFHSTAFPLRHVKIEGKSIFNAIREIIYESVKDVGLNNALDGAMMETLKWIAYEKWNTSEKKNLEKFGCPHCLSTTGKNLATLPYNVEKGNCPNCGGEIFITDLFGLHYSMSEDFAPNQIASDYMTVAETLMIFTPIRYFWETNKETLQNCLMVKDGPLALRATLSKLARPIRDFFKYAKSQGIEVALIGQEKTGAFAEHLQIIGDKAPKGTIFIPNNDYIRSEIQHLNTDGIYGQDTNYGAKVFIKLNDFHKMVLNIPTGQKGEFVENPSIDNLIAIKRIVATLPEILSSRYEGALLPIELANGVASLSTYPSAKALELFAEAIKRND
jgi:hypothetical protein